MTQYAHYISETEVRRPTDAEFKGIPNWRQHDGQLRKHGYVPLEGAPEPRLGVTPTPARYRDDGDHITVLEWTYTPIEPPEPQPLPRRFSKSALLEALMGCSLYEQAKAIYLADSDLQIAWAAFSDINMDYQACKSIMQQHPGLFTTENVQALQEYIRDHSQEAK